jgi:hypothetical protein
MVDDKSAELPGDGAILARLKILEDRTAIVELLHRVCFTIDSDVAGDWLDCFVAEGVFSWGSDPDAPPVLDLRGREALASWFNNHRASNPVGSQTHIVLHPMVTVTGDTATVASSYMTLRIIGGDLLVASAGRYADRAWRDPKGRWRLVERRAIGTMMRTAATA